MVERVLVAVDDSPAALGAARLAVDLARGWGASLRAITVLVDGAVIESIQSIRPDPDVEARIGEAGATVLAYTERMADEAGIPIEPVMRSGEAHRCILDEASEWRADVIVMGRSDRKGPASPYIGSQVARVLEFADCPVLVVPQ